METLEANHLETGATCAPYGRVFGQVCKWLAGVMIGGILGLANASGQPNYSNPFLFTTIAGAPTNNSDAPGIGAQAGFSLPYGIVWSTNGNLYVADYNGNTIRQVTPVGANWQVSTIAGSGAYGHNDGTGLNATFYEPAALAVDGSNNLYVADSQNSLIRKLTLVGGNWVCTTIAGTNGPGTVIDGTNLTTRFSYPAGIAADAAGNVYVADTENNVIRKLTPVGTNWVVTTIAGTNTFGLGSSVDGTNQMAQFSQPWGIAVDSHGNLYVADSFSDVIREVQPVGTNWVVTTIAGSAGNFGFTDGTNDAAAFDSPDGIAVDANTNLYVADTLNNAIRKISPAGTNWVTTTLGGGYPDGSRAGPYDGIGTNAFFTQPYGVTADNAGNIYIADTLNYTIRKGTNATLPSLTISQTGAASVLVSWPGTLGTLQTNSTLTAGTWGLFAGTVSVNNGTNTVTVPIVNANLYFRLTE